MKLECPNKQAGLPGHQLKPHPALPIHLLLRRLPLCLAVLPVFLKPMVAPWIFMWSLAFALYAGCKWLTYCDARMALGKPRGKAALFYLFFWPGMNARSWQERPAAGTDLPWWAVVRTFLGAALIWLVVPLIPSDHAWLIGWTGMVGVVILLHFGSFHLLSIGWRAAGFNAPPIMVSPLHSRTLAEFWGRRWNRAFHELAGAYLFKPMQRRFGARAGILVAFFVSGLVHELVITVPAGGGFGGPTLYFVLQAAGMLAEKTRAGLLLNKWSMLGRAWTLAITALPAPLLFPSVFVERIILPMLHTMGAY